MELQQNVLQPLERIQVRLQRRHQKWLHVQEYLIDFLHSLLPLGFFHVEHTRLIIEFTFLFYFLIVHDPSNQWNFLPDFIWFYLLCFLNQLWLLRFYPLVLSTQLIVDLGYFLDDHFDFICISLGFPVDRCVYLFKKDEAETDFATGLMDQIEIFLHGVVFVVKVVELREKVT